MPYASLDETLDVMAGPEYGQGGALSLIDKSYVVSLFVIRSR